jgi:hypothetical protein
VVGEHRELSMTNQTNGIEKRDGKTAVGERMAEAGRPRRLDLERAWQERETREARETKENDEEDNLLMPLRAFFSHPLDREYCTKHEKCKRG